MKISVIFVVLCLSAAFADKLALSNQMKAMLELKARANDAVQSGLDLLTGLKDHNIKEQATADEVHEAKMTELDQQIADMTYIADTNKNNGDAATEHRKYLEHEIDVTQQYLAWIIKRRESLHKKREELTDQRCVASMAFVKALKEHDEALEVVVLLKADVVGIVEEKTGVHYEGLVQIQDAFDRVSAYAHLFNEQQLNQFKSLAQQEAVDPESLEHDTNADDNDRAGLQLEAAPDGSGGRNVAERFIDMINKLHQHLLDSMADLKTNEIEAAWNLVNWMQDSEQELVHLDEEQEQNITYIDKLTINIVGAKAHEDRVWEIYFGSAEALNDTIASRQPIIDDYEDEKERRQEENLILDECISIYKERVATLDKGTVAAVDDLQDDGSFNNSNGNYDATQQDAIAAKDQGNLAANVAAESGAY